MKLNLGCGRETKVGFVNIDCYERENKLDVICDLTKRFPFESDSSEYIYAEQLIEHFTWLDGFHFLQECYRCLKYKGVLRLVLPDYALIFKKYLEGDQEFFKVFFDGLNNFDYPYYSEVYTDPDKILRERVDNPPPEWHTSPRLEDRKRLELRVRNYTHLIEVVHWLTHQYGEHKTLYDLELLTELLERVGFSRVYETERKDIDSHAPTRITSSIYIEAKK